MKRVSMLGIFVMLISCTGTPTPPPSATYETTITSASNQTLHSSYSATISGSQVVEIRPQVSGFITSVNVSEGASVKKGQTLFVIDQVGYIAALQTAEANVASAQAALATAELTVKSKEQLFAANVVSDFDLQTAKNACNVARATLAQATAQRVSASNNLSYTVVKSPTDGVIGMIAYRVGALVSSSIAEPLVTVSDNNSMHVYFSMTENQILALARTTGPNQDVVASLPPVELRLSDGTLYSQRGTIDAISGIVDAKTGAVAIRATFTNPDRVLRSGGSGNIVMPYQKNNSIIIAQGATYEIQDRTYVYRVEGGKAKSTQITVFGVNDGQSYIVESGLNIGDTIVAQGAGFVHEGDVITTKN